MVALEHQYTQDGLAPDMLKGADRARAQVLFDAAEQAGCVAHLALITLWQLGEVDYEHRSYSRRSRWGYRSRYDDYDDDLRRRARDGGHHRHQPDRKPLVGPPRQRPSARRDAGGGR